MSIKGLTDRGLSFPEIGQIRKGAKKDPNKNAPGADLSYFRVEFDEREVKAAETFGEIYKEFEGKPTAIRIILPFNEIEKMWDAWLEAYTAGRMVARADGEYYVYLIDTDTGELLVKNGIDIKTHMPRPYSESQPVGYYVDGKGKKKPIFCKPSGRLKVILPELARAAYLTVMTTSVHDIANISDQLRAFQALNNGRIAGIPLILRRRPKSISTPNADGTRARRVKWLISIEADPEWVKAALQETKRLALPGNGLALLESDNPLAPHDEPPGPEELDLDEGEAEGDAGDVTEGQFTTPEPEAEKSQGETKSQPAPLNGAQRPYTADVLRAKLIERGNKDYPDKHVSKEQIGLLAHLLDICFAGHDDYDLRRHAIQKYLFGVESLNDAPPPTLYAALNAWLMPKKDSGGEYRVDPMAVTEINLVYAQVLKDQGQLAMQL